MQCQKCNSPFDLSLKIPLSYDCQHKFCQSCLAQVNFGYCFICRVNKANCYRCQDIIGQLNFQQNQGYQTQETLQQPKEVYQAQYNYQPNNYMSNLNVQQTISSGQNYQSYSISNQFQRNCFKHSKPLDQICLTCYSKVCISCAYEHPGHTLQNEQQAMQIVQQQQAIKMQEMKESMPQVNSLKQQYHQNLFNLQSKMLKFENELKMIKEQTINEVNQTISNKEKEFQAISKEHSHLIKKQIANLQNIQNYAQVPYVAPYVSLEQLIQFSQNYDAADGARQSLIDNKIQYKFELALKDQQGLQKVQELLNKSINFKIYNQIQSNQLKQIQLPNYNQSNQQSLLPNTTQATIQVKPAETSFAQNTYFVQSDRVQQLQPNNNYQITVETLIKNELQENDMNGVLQTIQLLQQWDVSNIDVKKVCSKYRLYYKDPSQAALQYINS